MAVLTLTIDEDVLVRAERAAAASNTTVPEMVERLLRAVAQPPPRREDLPPITRQLWGIAPPMSDEEVERVLHDHRMRKYGGGA